MSETIQLPVFVDLHDHFREPSSNPAETIASGTKAALHGGYMYTNDMPNNPGHETWTLERVEEKQEIAQRTARTFIGFYAGWQPGNGVEPEELARMAPQVVGLKSYLTKTTGNDAELEVIDMMDAVRVFHEAAPDKPIMIHPANLDQVMQYGTDVVKRLQHHVHVCHVNDPDVARYVAQQQAMGHPMTSGVTPHHLLLTSHDTKTRGAFAEMMPELAEQVDAEELLFQLATGVIDVVETDHAPHDYSPKMRATVHEDEHCYGVPNVDLAFPVLFRLAQTGLIGIERLVDAMATQPARIMGIKPPTGTYNEWSTDAYRIDEENEYVKSQAGWTPFLGVMAAGQLQRTVVAGQEIYHRGRTRMAPLAAHNFNPIITSNTEEVTNDC